LELMYNGGPCELRQQCKRLDAYPVGEQDTVSATHLTTCFNGVRRR
jgi:hypothetical protein